MSLNTTTTPKNPPEVNTRVLQSKAVIARPSLLRGKACFRVIVPLSITRGKRKIRFFQKKADAEAFAQACETTRRQITEGYQLLRLVDRIRLGRAMEKAGGLDHLEKAVEEYVLTKPNAAATVDDLAAECLAAKAKAGLAKSYLSAIANTFKRFRELFGPRLVSSVRATEIESWLHARTSDAPRWAPETQKGYLKDLRTLYSYAIDRGYAKENPALSVAMPKASKGVPGILTVPEVELLMRTLERQFPDFIPYIALTLFGGLRAEEAFRCRWEHIKESVIDLPAGRTKNNRRRLIEFAALEVGGVCAIRKWLDLSGPLPPKWRKIRMKQIRKAVPINWSDNCLRHSFVSYAVPVHGIALSGILADHSEAILKRHYRALVTRSDAERFWAILPVESCS